MTLLIQLVFLSFFLIQFFFLHFLTSYLIPLSFFLSFFGFVSFFFSLLSFFLSFFLSSTTSPITSILLYFRFAYIFVNHNSQVFPVLFSDSKVSHYIYINIYIYIYIWKITLWHSEGQSQFWPRCSKCLLKRTKFGNCSRIDSSLWSLTVMQWYLPYVKSWIYIYLTSPPQIGCGTRLFLSVVRI